MMPPPLMHGFLRAQFTYLLRTFPLRRSWRHKLWILADGVHLFIAYVWLLITLRFANRAGPIAGKTCAAVLLTHNRPQNISLLVEGALRNRFVTSVIVSNSNPRVKIRDWVASTDSRLLLVDETSPTQPGHRLVLARQTGAKYVLAIDDDIFFTPEQWKDFFGLLLADEQCPHGIIGQVYRPGTTSSNGSPFHHVVGRETEVDVLIGAYAFTSEHLKRVFELAAKIGILDLSQVRNYDDVLLSFGGTKPPRIHPLKPALVCASASLPGVALWKSDEQFWIERERIFEKARAARLALDSPWVAKSEFEQQVSQP
jgi:hypothetical protein